MKIFHGINTFKDSKYSKIKNNVFTIGMFDGLHLGHKQVINSAKKIAKNINGKVFVLTFDIHPKELLSPNQKPFILTTNTEKLQILENMQIDGVIFLYFDNHTANMSPEDFVQKEIVSKLNPYTIVVGEDFRFGKGKKGDANLIKKFTNTKIIPILKNNEDLKISSTNIRKLIYKGEIEKANQMLGHNYFIFSQVVHGFELGTKFDVPTANLHIPNLKLLPKGVFAGITQIKGVNYPSAVSIGKRETLDKKDLKLCCESHIIDFKQDIYHKELKVEFLQKIRNQKKFQSLEKLFKQIKNDIEFIRNLSTIK